MTNTQPTLIYLMKNHRSRSDSLNRHRSALARKFGVA